MDDSHQRRYESDANEEDIIDASSTATTITEFSNKKASNVKKREEIRIMKSYERCKLSRERKKTERLLTDVENSQRKLDIESRFPMVHFVFGLKNIDSILQMDELKREIGLLRYKVGIAEQRRAILTSEKLTSKQKNERLLRFPIGKDEEKYIRLVEFTPGDEDRFYVQVDGKTHGDEKLLHRSISNLRGGSITSVPSQAFKEPAMAMLSKELMGIARKAFPNQFPFRCPKSVTMGVTEIGITFGGYRSFQYPHVDFPGYTIGDWNQGDYKVTIILPLEPCGTVLGLFHPDHNVAKWKFRAEPVYSQDSVASIIAEKAGGRSVQQALKTVSSECGPRSHSGNRQQLNRTPVHVYSQAINGLQDVSVRPTTRTRTTKKKKPSPSSIPLGIISSHVPQWNDIAKFFIPLKCALVLPGFQYHSGCPNEQDVPNVMGDGKKPGYRYCYYPRLFAKVEAFPASQISESIESAQFKWDNVGFPNEASVAAFGEYVGTSGGNVETVEKSPKRTSKRKSCTIDDSTAKL